MSSEIPEWYKDLRKKRKILPNNRYRNRIHEAGHAFAAVYFNFNLAGSKFGTMNNCNIENISVGRSYLVLSKGSGLIEDQSNIFSPDNWLLDIHKLIYCASGSAAVKVLLEMNERIKDLDLSNMKSIVRFEKSKTLLSSIPYQAYPLSVSAPKLIIKAAYEEAKFLMDCFSNEILKIADSEMDEVDKEELLKIIGIEHYTELWERIK